MSRECKITNIKKTLLEGHKARPVFSVNPPIDSRFAYKLKPKGSNKEIEGDWAIDSFSVNDRTFTYRKVKCRKG